MVHLYSVSGIPRGSESMSISFSSKSAILSCLGDSNMSVRASAVSSALSVMISSFPAHFRILLILVELNPRLMGRSQRKWSKPLDWRFTCTRETWEESMAWMESSSSEQSMFASCTRSFKASMSCLNTRPWRILASNMVDY